MFFAVQCVKACHSLAHPSSWWIHILHSMDACQPPVKQLFSLKCEGKCVWMTEMTRLLLSSLEQEEGGSKRGPVRWDAELPAELSDLPEPGPVTGGGWTLAGEAPMDGRQSEGATTHNNRGTVSIRCKQGPRQSLQCNIIWDYCGPPFLYPDMVSTPQNQSDSFLK